MASSSWPTQTCRRFTAYGIPNWVKIRLSVDPLCMSCDDNTAAVSRHHAEKTIKLFSSIWGHGNFRGNIWGGVVLFSAAPLAAGNFYKYADDDLADIRSLSPYTHIHTTLNHHSLNASNLLTMAIQYPYVWIFCGFASLGAFLYGFDGVYFNGVSTLGMLVLSLCRGCC